MIGSKLRTGLGLLAVLLVTATPCKSQTLPLSPIEQRVIVARVNGTPIVLGDLEALYESLGNQVINQDFSTLLPELLDRAIQSHLIVQDAEKESIHLRPLVAARLKRAIADILTAARIEDVVEAAANPEAVAAVIATMNADEQPALRVRVQHILVDSRRFGQVLIGRLGRGESFDALARRHSTDFSARDGGRIGWVYPGTYPQAFEVAVFSQLPPSIYPEPIETERGWHVIKVLERSSYALQAQEQLEANIRNSLRQTALSRYIFDLEQGAEIIKLR